MKPCPFCGGTDVRLFVYPFPRPGLRGCYAICRRCGAATGKYETVKEAKEAWNHRESEEQKE